MASIFLLVIIFLITSFLVKKLIFSSFLNTKKKYPPSPLPLPIIGHLYLFKKPLHQTLYSLSKRYGPILSLRFGSRPVLVVTSFLVAEECFTKNDVVFANRVHFPSSKLFTYNFSTIGTANYGPHWRNIRRIATVDVLSSHRLNVFGNIRTAEVYAMVKKLFTYHANSCESGTNGFALINLKSVLFGFALKNMMNMIAGKLYEDRINQEMNKFQETVEELFSNSGASNIEDFLPILRLMNLKKLIKKSSKAIDYIDEFLQGLINEYREQQKEHGTTESEKTMIGGLIALQETDPDQYSDTIIKAIFYSMLAAGTDTSSDTVEWAMALLLNNPDKLRKAQAEIEEKIGNKKLLEESDLQNLPYLQCIIAETLRLYPAGPLLVPHESSEDCIVGGYNVEKGTMLLVNVYRIHRDPSIWENPEEFVPERFENMNGEMEGKMFPFGMGRRRCPGEGLARRVVGLSLGTLLQCFEWRRVGDESLDMSEGGGLALSRAHPLKAMYRPIESLVDYLGTM